MIDKLQRMGAATLHGFRRLGRGTLFFLAVILSCGSMFTRPSLLIKQMYSVGVQTLIIIIVAGLFVGMVMALQSYYALVDFGAEDSVGVMVALS